jgi:ferredoxin
MSGTFTIGFFISPETHTIDTERRRRMAAIEYPDRCNGCGLCCAVCPHEAITLYGNTMRVNSTLCRECGSCVRVCPRDAVKLHGRHR